MKKRYSRRQVLKMAGGLAATAALGGRAAASPGAKGPVRKRALRIAHLTDIHVQPERAADQGLIACLHHVQSQPDKPDVIFNSGDTIMDSLAADYTRTEMLWKLWRSILEQECSLPIEHCIGNHDVWGWNREKSGATGAEPLYGKKWAMEALGLSSRYRSFDRAGWHFIFLDSTYPHEETVYTARLDEEQFEWLESDLASVKKGTPVLVFSHIPILCACVFFDGDNEETGNWVVPGAWMHIDARRIKDLFLKHPAVKLCLSGHVHLHDRVDYNGVTYVCNGAVCGGWWKGPYQECEPGYGLVNLYTDGSFDAEYVTYGWKARE